MRKKLLMIMNPKSGTMLAPKHLADIVTRFSNAGYLTQILMTSASGDARAFAMEHGSDVDTIVVSGGDGTFNEVVDGIITAGIDANIGYIPSGTTNDFATSLGLPKSIFDCADTVVEGKPVQLDVGNFNGRYFSYVASFGAFTSTSYKVPQTIKNILGHTAYVLAGIKDIMNIKPIHAKITCDEGTKNEKICEDDYIFGAICNSTSVAGILKLNKFDIDMNDGLLEVLLVKMPHDLIEINDIVANMLDGRLRSDQIEFFSAKDIKVEIDAGTPWTLDGEYEEGRRICHITTERSAISVIRQ